MQRTHDNRSIRAFILAHRQHPGFRLQVTAMMCFGAGVAVSEGLQTLFIATLVGVAIVALIGYPTFRRRGRLYND